MIEPRDTTADAERKQLDLLRRLTPSQRASLASRMTNRALQRAKAGIARARPELDRQGIDLLFVEVHYGRELARKLVAFLAMRGEGRHS
jgi:hypothetical protein